MSHRDQEVEEIWANFWEDFICDEDGNLDIDRVKEELADYHNLKCNIDRIEAELEEEECEHLHVEDLGAGRMECLDCGTSGSVEWDE